MDYDHFPLSRQAKNAMKDYSLKQLLDFDLVETQLEAISEAFSSSIVLKDTKSSVLVYYGDAKAVTLSEDVVAAGLRIATIYYEENKGVDRLVKGLTALLGKLAEETCIHLMSEDILYSSKKHVFATSRENGSGERRDELTGVLTWPYFDSKMKVIDRSEVLPVAVVIANINDWKFVNDNFGDQESDRLIRIVADVLKENAKPEYVIGRCDGDVFGVLIPMAEEEEAVRYCEKVREQLEGVEDSVLYPSVAMGVAYKTNVENTLTELYSDAEYLMFEDKLAMKNRDGYREKLEKGLTKKRSNKSKKRVDD